MGGIVVLDGICTCIVNVLQLSARCEMGLDLGGLVPSIDQARSWMRSLDLETARRSILGSTVGHVRLLEVDVHGD